MNQGFYQRFNQQFNHHHRINVPAFFCELKTEAGRRFRDKYGEVYVVQQYGKLPGELHLVVALGTGKTIEVKKTSEGIFVDGKLFAESWEDEEIKEIEDENT